MKYVQQHILTDFDLGEMEYYDDRILLVKSSEEINLYQIEDEIEVSVNRYKKPKL